MPQYTINLLDDVTHDEELSFKIDIAKALLYVNPMAISECINSFATVDYNNYSINNYDWNEIHHTETIELSDGVTIEIRLFNSNKLVLEIVNITLNFDDNSYTFNFNNFDIRPLITAEEFSSHSLLVGISKIDINSFKIKFQSHTSPIDFIIDQFFEFTDIENVW